MSKPWEPKPLWHRVFMSEDRVHLHAIRIIGYGECNPMAFYDEAKKLKGYKQPRYEQAVRDLTVFTYREGPNCRYVLTQAAKKIARLVIGPPPDDPGYADWWRRRLISVAEM